MSGPILGGLIGALLAFTLNVVLRIWQYRHEHWVGRAEQFCDRVMELSDYAVQYYCLKSIINDNSSTDDKNKVNELATKLIGWQIQIEGLFESFDYYFDEDEINDTKKALILFSDALTGGPFQTESVSDPSEYTDYARVVQVCASELVVSMQRSTDEALQKVKWPPRSFRRK